MLVEHQGVKVECVTGDITRQQDIAAVVNAANAELMTGGGVAGAIHRAAGPALAEECAPLAPIEPGEAVITGGHDLPNSRVIHCLGPRWGIDEPADDLLASCYRRALQLADEQPPAGLESIAFPSISTGAFGYPMEPAAAVAFTAVREAIPTLKRVRHIRFVLYDGRAQRIHEEAMRAAFNVNST